VDVAETEKVYREWLPCCGGMSYVLGRFKVVVMAFASLDLLEDFPREQERGRAMHVMFLRLMERRLSCLAGLEVIVEG